MVRFVPQASGFWGDVSGGVTDTALNMHEADLLLSAEDWSLQIGRFEMAYGDHLVIGTVGWHETARTFDGMRWHKELNGKKGYVDVFATSTSEGTSAAAPSAGFAAGDSYFVGVPAGLGAMIDALQDFDGYLLGRLTPSNSAAATPQTHTAMEVTLGSRVKHKVDSMTVRAEGGLQFGKRPAADESVFAFHADGDVMLALTPTASFGLGGLFASGDDPSTSTDEGWNQLYPTAHKFLGFMDVIGGRNNIASGNVKLRLKPTEPITLALDTHFFMRPETSSGVNAYTGVEWDAWMLYPLGKGIGVRTQYSAFPPSDGGVFGTNDLIHYFEMQLAFKH